MLRLTLFIPEALSLFATASSTRVPFTAMTILNPLSLPYSMMSKISGLISGSPPVRMTVGSEKDRMSSMMALHSSVESSPS
ncbi:MAG: hypothetical protein A4E61_00818 [Syntrophorhabdus sp. PtaB.Bin184]|nr:MAG: hypothetical protein A4E61_00818 [Syntrophorhabdus sp. PtaB.Bin184]